MKLVELECKNCGGNLKIEEGTDIVTCPYCNATYKLDDENMEQSGYEFEKGRIKAQKEHLASTTAASSQTVSKAILIPIIFIAAFIIMVIIIGIATGNKGGESSVSVNQFNLNYNHGRQPGVFVESDLADIIESNKKYSKKITLKYEDKETSDPAEIAEIKKNMDLSADYEVTLDYDKDGYICSYTLEMYEGTSKESENQKQIFNLYYHAGVTYGNLVVHQLDEVVKSNETNSQKKITVKYKDTETTEPSEIEAIGYKLDDFKEYEIILDYDSHGFVNSFKIVEK